MNETEILNRLDRIEHLLTNGSQASPRKNFYSTADVAQRLHRAEFTVREWCRQGRIHAEKRACGRGVSREWMISHEEIQRIDNEGLLPL